MSILSDATLPENTSKTEEDVLGGGGYTPLPTDIYKFEVKSAYVELPSSGSQGIAFEFVVDGQTFSTTEYFRSSTKKGGKTTYTSKKANDDGSFPELPLPGFITVSNILKFTTGKTIAESPTEKKYVEKYVDGKKQNVEVDMLKGIQGKEIYLAIRHEIENKNVKNALSGEYEPTNEKRESNTIAGVFNKDKLTASEIDKGVNEPAFYNKWLDRWKGETINKFKEVAGGGTAGAPAKKTTKLFANEPTE